MQVELKIIKLVPMIAEMYRSYFIEYENDSDLYLPGQVYDSYEYNEEKVAEYIQRHQDLKRIPLAIMYDDEIVSEIIIKIIEKHTCATMGITLKKAQ